VSGLVGAATLAVGAALALTGQACQCGERRRRLSGRRPRPGVALCARRALRLGLAMIAAGALAFIASR
jgi:hypothetical protein